MYMVALANSTKKLKPQDVLQLPWDKKETTIDIEEIKKAQAEMLEHIKNNKESKPVQLADLI